MEKLKKKGSKSHWCTIKEAVVTQKADTASDHWSSITKVLFGDDITVKMEESSNSSTSPISIQSSTEQIEKQESVINKLK